MVLDKTVKLLRSKSAKWRGSNSSVTSLQSGTSADTTSTHSHIPDASHSVDNSSRQSQLHDGPRAAWGGELLPVEAAEKPLDPRWSHRKLEIHLNSLPQQPQALDAPRDAQLEDESLDITSSRSIGKATNSKLDLLEYLVNADPQGNHTPRESHMTLPGESLSRPASRGRARRPVSRMRAKVSITSPSPRSSRIKQDNMSPDYYTSPLQDPETMVSREWPQATNRQTKPAQSKSKIGTSPRCSDSSSANNMGSSMQFLKTVTDGLSKASKQNCRALRASYDGGEDISVRLQRKGYSMSQSNLSIDRKDVQTQTQNEARSALKSLTYSHSLPRRSASVKISPIDEQKRTTRSTVHAHTKNVALDETDRHQENEVSRQVKQFAGSPEHFKAGAHFQHLYMKRAQTIVQRQMSHKSQALHVTLPQQSDPHLLNEYGMDIPTQSKVPVLRMTVAKVTNSSKTPPTKTTIAVHKNDSTKEKSPLHKGYTTKETVYASDFSESSRGKAVALITSEIKDSNNSVENNHYFYQEMGESVTKDMQGKDSITSIQKSSPPTASNDDTNMSGARKLESSKSRVHFSNAAAEEQTPSFPLSRRTSILKKGNHDVPHQQNNYKVPHQQDNYEVPHQQNNYEVPHQQSNHEVSQPSVEVPRVQRNRGTAIIAVHQDPEDKPKPVLRRRISFLAPRNIICPKDTAVSTLDIADEKASGNEGKSSTDVDSSIVNKLSAQISMKQEKPSDPKIGSTQEIQTDIDNNNYNSNNENHGSKEDKNNTDKHSTKEKYGITDRSKDDHKSKFDPNESYRNKYAAEPKDPDDTKISAGSKAVKDNDHNQQIATRFQIGMAKPTKSYRYVKPEVSNKKRDMSPRSLLKICKKVDKQEEDVSKDERKSRVRRRRSKKIQPSSTDEDSTDVRSILKLSRSPRRHSKKSRDSMDTGDDKKGKVDHSLLVEYLILVRDNQEEYLEMRNCGSSRKPVKSIVGIAGAYRRGHHEPGQPESLVVQAAYELGSKIPHPVCVRYEKMERERASMIARASLAMQRSVSKRHFNDALEMLAVEHKPAVSDEHKFTTMERCKAELEIWLRGLTSAQQLKVKEVALKEMGEEAHSIRKWWLSQKYCKYLRQKTSPAIMDHK